MHYISAFFLLPSTIVLIINVLLIFVDESEDLTFYIENPILDYGFLLVFFLSSLAGWLGVIFSVPARDQGKITLVGKGVIAGLVCWPYAYITQFLDGKTVIALCLSMGWVGLSVQLLPDLSRIWQRRLPVLGLAGVVLAIPVLVTPFTWSQSKLMPMPEARWGIYYPDYDREEDREFVEIYQDHEKKFDKQPKLIISKAGMFMINLLGNPLSNTFGHCGPDGALNIFSSSFREDGCDAPFDDDAWDVLKVEFYEPGKLRCVNCRRFGKPEYWMVIGSLPEDYRLFL